jgi:NAD(P)-dependent dehydrogenase (short-subunit alcohol dehydrogenase family)
MKRSVYDLLYRFGAPWDGPPRADLVRLVESGVVTPTRLAPGRAIDLGCGTGANVRYLAEHGFDAVGVDYSRVALEIARKRAADAGTPASARFVEGDITADRVAGIEGVFDLVLDFGTLDDLDAGGRRSIARDDATIERVFAVNWWGTVYLDRAFLPILLERPEGHIVNVSSMGGFLPVPGQTIYGASKAAVKLLTEGLHSECAGTNVHITVVLPGAVATNITTNSGVAVPISGAKAEAAARRTLSADKAARIILDGMEKDAYRVMVGSDAKLMDRLYRLNPRRAAGFIAKQMRDLLGG